MNPKSIPRAQHASLSLGRWTAGEVEIRGADGPKRLRKPHTSRATHGSVIVTLSGAPCRWPLFARGRTQTPDPRDHDIQKSEVLAPKNSPIRMKVMKPRTKATAISVQPWLRQNAASAYSQGIGMGSTRCGSSAPDQVRMIRSLAARFLRTAGRKCFRPHKASYARPFGCPSSQHSSTKSQKTPSEKKMETRSGRCSRRRKLKKNLRALSYLVKYRGYVGFVGLSKVLPRA